jgi:ABC-type polysaccharide/polyol phosphate export permease
MAVANEVRKGLLHAWSERLQILIELPMFAVFILLLGPMLGQGHQIATGQLRWSLDSARTSLMVMWFVPFIFLYMEVVKMFWRLVGEIQAGTIEQVYLSPLPSWLVVATGRVLAAVAETIVVAAGTYGIVSVFVPLHIGWTPAALLPAALIVVAATGFSLIIAGATLVWRRIQMLNDTLLMMAFLASAAAVPLITVPSWWADISLAFPLTSGVANLYDVLIQHQPVTSPWGDGGLLLLAVTAVGYLLAGIVAFRLGERTAKRRGTLARY